MNWWGKILGGAFGMMLGGPVGALLGIVLGHNLDKGVEKSGSGIRFGKQERIQTLFYTTTFAVMGHVCKADGRVSENEISLARQIMQQMDMDSAQKKMAMKLFNEGKKADFPLQAILQQFRQEIGYRPNLVRMFLEIQIMAAYADGVMHQQEREVLLTICQLLNVSRHEFDHLCAMLGGMHKPGRKPDEGPTLKQAFAVLDLPEDASREEIKRAYRRLLSQHHPDKLVAKGLPEEMMKLAAERTHEIRQAYELIKKNRGF